MHDNQAAPGSQFSEKLKWSLLALLLLGYTLLLRLPGLLLRDSPIHSDAPGFLFVLALLRGEWRGASAPFRIEYPVYPYLIYIANHFVPDWVQAAKWAAFIPSALTPFAVFGATQVMSRDRSAAYFSAVLAASSPALIQVGTAPLYDSTFVLMLALFLIAGFLFVRKPTWRMAILLGIVAGISCASRALGFFLVPPILCAIAVLPGIPVSRKYRLSAIVLASLFLVAGSIRLPAKMEARSLPPDQTQCVKDVMLDGIRYAGENRDATTYRLNQSATAFQFDESSPCKLTWKQYAATYYKAEIRTFFKNLKKIVLYDFVIILAPFAVLFIPLTLGSLCLMREGNAPDYLLLGTICVSFVFFVSAIQYQDRYLFPLIVLVCIVSGIGCTELWKKGRFARSALVFLLLVAVIGGIDGCRQVAVADEGEANYRKACQWIVEHNGADFQFGVMSRHHGIYVYLKHGLVLLPADEPQRVEIFANHSNVKYVLAGPEERRHNPALFDGVAFLRPVTDFGTGPQSVQILEVIHDGANARAFVISSSQ